MKLIVANNGSTTSYRGNRTGRIKTRTYGANKGIFFSNSDRNSKKKKEKITNARYQCYVGKFNNKKKKKEKNT